MPNIISLDFISLDVYNLALYNNLIPLIDEILVKNISDYNLKNLEVEITSNPAFFAPSIIKIPEIASGRYVVVNSSNINIDVDLTKIMYSSTPTDTVLSVKIKSSGETLCDISKNIVILPYNYFPPITMYSELLASFVTPGQDAIKKIADRIYDKIRDNHDISVNSDMWDYNDKKTTTSIIKAIYEVIRDLKITLDTVNILSENKPVKIKLPETTYLTRSANGLEIALLVASVSEHLGLRPFIVFANEKVLVGVFCLQKSFSTCVSDDGRIFSDISDSASKDFCLIDTTSFMNGTQVSFSDSLITANKAIASAEYPIVIDVFNARKSGYAPIPNRITQNGNLIFEIREENSNFHDTINDKVKFKSLSALCSYVKRGFLSANGSNTLTDMDISKNVYLVGGVKNIMTKLLFNGKLTLKSFPLPNAINDKADFLPQLEQLNINLNCEDLSNTTNAFHDKDSLAKRIISVLNDGKNEFSSICLALGSVKYLHNSQQMTAPLLLIRVLIESGPSQGIYIKLADQKIIANEALIDIFTTIGINTASLTQFDDIMENYSYICEAFKYAISDYHGFEFYDTVSISAFNLDCYSLSCLASTDYFQRSSIISKLLNAELFTDNKLSQASALDYPFALDETQINAINSAINNECTIIKGANGSGKTRVCASIAFSQLRRGKRVLYLTDTESNATDFMKFASLAHFDNFVYMVPYKTKRINSFSDDVFENISNDITSVISEKKFSLTNLISRHNEYYEALHKVNEIGFSLYESASQYERYRSFPYLVTFTNSDISQLTKEDVVMWFDAVSSLAKAGADCKEPYSNALSFIREKNFSYDLKSKATILLSRHLTVAQNFINLQNQIAEYLGSELSIMKEKQTDVLINILDVIKNYSDSIHYGIFTRASIESDLSLIESLALQCDDIFKIKSFINDNFTEDIINLNCDSLLLEWRNANSKVAFFRSSAQNDVKNKIRPYCLNPKFITNDNFVDVINNIIKYKHALSVINDNASLVYQVTGLEIKSMVAENDEKTFDKIKLCAEISRKYLSLINDLYVAEQKPDKIFTHQVNLFKNKEKLIFDLEPFFSLNEQYAEYKHSEQELATLLDIDMEKAREDNSKIWYYFVLQFINRLNDNIDMLKYWCNWNIEKEKAISIGLENVVKLYESEQITSNDIKNAFLKGFFKSVTEYFLSCETAVSAYSSETQKKDISVIYNELDSYRRLLYQDLLNTVSVNYKSYTKNVLNTSSVDAVEVLKNHFAYGINFNADAQTVELLQNAKPCFVSDSVSFITKFSNLPQFDTIIVDVLTQKQQEGIFLLLPLTKNLVVIDSDIENSSDIKFSDFFRVNKAPVCELGWIYSTIYSSQLVNELFYNNSLSAFVYSNRYKNGLSVITQNGTYDRRKTRVNVIEASAVVDELMKLRSENKPFNVGVYTITEEQKNLIEMLFCKRVNNSAEIKTKISEGLFIRCLDEAMFDARETIIFSTVFSAEERPKYKDTVTKTIPELSKDNSISKLINILSSAKNNFTLITSLSKDTLQKFKTTEKNYLIFKKCILRLLSENTFLPQSISGSVSGENSIIRVVTNHIEALGYKVDLNLGVNKCKLDIAVRRKGESNYLLGIIFDESAYITSKDFLERNLVASGLRDFGKWKILRLFTVDWFENHAKQLDMITSALNGDEFNSGFNFNQHLE